MKIKEHCIFSPSFSKRRWRRLKAANNFGSVRFERWRARTMRATWRWNERNDSSAIYKPGEFPAHKEVYDARVSSIAARSAWRCSPGVIAVRVGALYLI